MFWNNCAIMALNLMKAGEYMPFSPSSPAYNMISLRIFLQICPKKRAEVMRFGLWPYSSLQGIANACIALRLLRSSFVTSARPSSLPSLIAAAT